MKVIIFFLTALTLINAQLKETFYIPDGPVTAIAADNNTVYIAGEFNFVGPLTQYAAAIDLKTGEHDPSFPVLEGPVSEIISDGNEGYIILGSNTHQQGAIPKSILYRLNSDYTILKDLAVRTDSEIRTITVWNRILFIAGWFQKVNDQPRDGIAALDIETGELLGWGKDMIIEGGVERLFVYNERLYIGGSFWRVNGVPRQSLAAVSANTGELINWNPTVNGGVTFLDQYNGYLVAAGFITFVNSLPRKGIAFIDMQNAHVTDWSIDIDPSINKILFHNGKMYIGGGFRNIQGKEIKNFAEVDLITKEVSDWTPQFSADVRDMELYDSLLVIGGTFANLGRLIAVNIFTKQLVDLKISGNNTIYTLCPSQNKVLAGGLFTSLKSYYRRGLAALDIQTGRVKDWHPGISIPSQCLAVHNGMIYSGGQTGLYVFDETGSVKHHLPLANNESEYIYALGVSSDKVYIGGRFTFINGYQRHNLAAFNTVTNQIDDWSPSAGSPVNTISVSGNKVCVGGQFTYMGGTETSSLVVFDNMSGDLLYWKLDSGSSVYGSAILNNTLYAADYYRIKAYDLGTGDRKVWVDPAIESYPVICAAGKYLFSGATYWDSRLLVFDVETGTKVNWEWQTDGPISSFAVQNNLMFMGGNFLKAGEKLRPYFAAVLVEPVTSVNEDDTPVVKEFYLYQNYPNPFNAGTIIRYNLPSEDFINIKLFDQLGNEIITLVNDKRSAGEHSFNFNAPHLSSGIYFCRLTTSGFSQTRKLLLIK